MLDKYPDLISIKKHPANKVLLYSKITKTPIQMRVNFNVKKSSLVSMSLDLTNKKHLASLMKRNNNSSMFQNSRSPE